MQRLKQESNVSYIPRENGIPPPKVISTHRRYQCMEREVEPVLSSTVMADMFQTQEVPSTLRAVQLRAPQSSHPNNGPGLFQVCAPSGWHMSPDRGRSATPKEVSGM